MADPITRLNAALEGRYSVERELGAGGMATVYLAEDSRHHRKVALKVLRPDLAATLGPERFLKEIEIAAGLTHPHILPLHDSGEADGFLFYVLPYIDGESLRDRIVREGELPSARPFGFSETWSTRWRTHTTKGWSTATSSPTMSCSAVATLW